MKNTKNQEIKIDETYKKSNEFALSKLSHKLELVHAQMLEYAIYNLNEKDGVSYYTKKEIEDKYNKDITSSGMHDGAAALSKLQFSLRDNESDRSSYKNVTQSVEYNRGELTVVWTNWILPHLQNLKDRYILNSIAITSRFSSSYTYRLYDFLKANYGRWYLEVKKSELMEMFCVSDVKSYTRNTSVFKRKVLDVAISEINEHTELEVRYTEIKRGRAITGFELNWTKGKVKEMVTSSQIKASKRMIDILSEKAMEVMINKGMEEMMKAKSLLEKSKKLHDNILNQEYEEAKKTLSYLKLVVAGMDQILLAPENKKNEDPPLYNWLED